jgi:hypothetical protein
LTTTSTAYLLTNNIGNLSTLSKHLWRYSLFNLIQLIDPPFQTLRKTPDLLPGQHPRLHPCDDRVLFDLVDRTCDELEADREEKEKRKKVRIFFEKKGRIIKV